MIIANYYDPVISFVRDTFCGGRGNRGDEQLVPDWSNAEWTAKWPGEDEWSIESKLHRGASQRTANMEAGMAGVGSREQTKDGYEQEKDAVKSPALMPSVNVPHVSASY